MLSSSMRTLVPLLLLVLPSLLLAMTVTIRKKPKLIVFDLDNTLWTPELYQLRGRSSGGDRGRPFRPIAGKDVRLFDGAATILERIRSGHYDADGIEFGVASRTQSVDWAFDLLEQFGLNDILRHQEIFSGNKDRHFANLAATTSYDYADMLFFDDARDGRFGNCVPVANLGVLAVHCPQGLRTVEIFDRALEYYCRGWNGSPGVIIEHDGTVRDTTGTTAAATTAAATVEQQRYQGVVKTVLTEKRYGFIRVVSDQDSANNRQQDVFFSFRNLPAGRTVQKGDAVSFRKQMDRRNGDKTFAADIQLEKAADASGVDGGGGGSSTKDGQSMTTTISLPAFSMGMPFAALLTNGCKTIETRNNRMLADHCPAGTKVLIHVGRRDFDDSGRYWTILQRTGRSDDAIRQLITLPPPAAKGMIVAICEVGMTYELSLRERSDPAVEDKIIAYGADSGYMATEIRRVAYLKRPVPCRGQGGIFTVDIDPAILPDGWTTLSTTTMTATPTNDARQNSRDDGRPPREGTRLVYSITG